MDLSKEDKHKLQQTKQTFKIQDLTKEQAEFILGRKLTDKGWQDYETSEDRKRKKTNTEVYSVKHLFRQLKKKPKKPDFSYSDIAKHVANKCSDYRLNNNSKVLMKYTGLQNYLNVSKIVTK